MNDLICSAITQRHLLRFVYDGYERIVEPHLYGINTANREMLSGYLVAGWSASAPEPGWRNYLVGEMADIHVLGTPFIGPRSGYNPEDRSMRQVFCRAEFAGTGPNADDLYRAGRERLEAGDPAAAVDLLERSAALEPHFLTLELLGEALAKLGRLREAVVPLAASAALHTQSRAPARLAEVFLSLERPDEASEMARRALAVDPENSLAAAVLQAARGERSD